MKQRLLLWFLTAVTLVACYPARAQVLIIANPSVKQSEISRADLSDIFNGATSSLKGAPVTPVLLKGGPVHDAMLSLYVGKSDSAFRSSWRSLLFSGQGAMPSTLASETAVVENVAHTPGAIGYIGKSTPHDGVKILTVR
jgi:ABC-type phosphate transport system substrate-binding protein